MPASAPPVRLSLCLGVAPVRSPRSTLWWPRLKRLAGASNAPLRRGALPALQAPYPSPPTPGVTTSPLFGRRPVLRREEGNLGLLLVLRRTPLHGSPPRPVNP